MIPTIKDIQSTIFLILGDYSPVTPEMSIYCVILQHSSEIDRAREILKQVYCEELGWEPPKTNPINHRVEDGMLKDDYDDKVIWLGAYDADIMIGCARVFLGVKGTHEVELFDPDNELFSKLPDSYIEINRIAVVPSYRRSNAVRIIMSYEFQLGMKYKMPILTTTTVTKLIKDFEGIFYHVGTMRYYPEDDETNVLVCWKPLDGFNYCQERIHRSSKL